MELTDSINDFIYDLHRPIEAFDIFALIVLIVVYRSSYFGAMLIHKLIIRIKQN